MSHFRHYSKSVQSVISTYALLHEGKSGGSYLLDEAWHVSPGNNHFGLDVKCRG